MKSPKIGLLAGVAILAAVTVWAATQTKSIQVRTGQLRQRPSFLGPVTASVDYGTRVTVAAQRGSWIQVDDGRGHSGWIHESALSDEKIVMNAGEADARPGASGDELALAGKGFNSEVEAEFRSKNRDVDFTWVDWMEGVKVTPEQAGDAMRQVGLGASATAVMLELYRGMDSGFFRSAEPRTAETTTPTTFAQFAEQVLKPALAQATVS